MVRTTTAVVAVISGIASRLEPPGMLRSRTSTAGRWALAKRTASGRLPASAITRSPGSASSRSRSPLRTTAWSSAITTVMSCSSLICSPYGREGVVDEFVCGVAAGEVAGEEAAGELSGRMPQRRGGHLGMVGVSERHAQVKPSVGEEEHRSQHRRRWRRVQGGAGLRGDPQRRGIGLLGGETALLDGTGRDVAGGEHVVRAGDARVRVDREEAAGVGV